MRVSRALFCASCVVLSVSSADPHAAAQGSDLQLSSTAVVDQRSCEGDQQVFTEAFRFVATLRNPGAEGVVLLTGTERITGMTVAATQADLDAGKTVADLEYHALGNNDDLTVAGQSVAGIKPVTIRPGASLERTLSGAALPVERVSDATLPGVLRPGRYVAHIAFVFKISSAKGSRWISLTSAPFPIDLPRQPKFRDCR